MLGTRKFILKAEMLRQNAESCEPNCCKVLKEFSGNLSALSTSMCRCASWLVSELWPFCQYTVPLGVYCLTLKCVCYSYHLFIQLHVIVGYLCSCKGH